MHEGFTADEAMAAVLAHPVVPSPDEPIELPGPDQAVVVAYVYGNNDEMVAHSWHASMRDLVGWDWAHHGRILAGGYIAMRCGTNGLIESRNNAVKEFLAEGRADWMFWCDTDMGFAPDIVDRLMAAADPVERPIVGALCFSQRADEPDGMGGWRVLPTPTIFDWAHVAEQQGFAVRWDYPANTVIRCAGTGSAAILIHRRVFEEIADKFGPVWYERVPNTTTGQLISEDLSFCVRAGALGIPLHVHTGVDTTHSKRFWMGAEDYWRMRALQPPPDLVAVQSQPQLSVHVDLAASLATLARDEHVHADGMLKLPADLDRYTAIIEATGPEVIVETGTRTGASARWFAELGVDVITVDIEPQGREESSWSPSPTTGVITYLSGRSSTDPDVIARVAELVDGRRCMVVLDSDHSAGHVAAEIGLYGPLVSPGCYLVAEDTLFGYAPPQLRGRHFPHGLDGSPLDAVAELLHDNPGWSRDIAVERMSPTSHHPAGFWLRNEDLS